MCFHSKRLNILVATLLTSLFLCVELFAGEVRVTLLHINDVYEIVPIENGEAGGMARVATLRKQLKAENPNTLMVLPGDFYSPSAIGTAVIDGKRLAGAQMVSVLNAAGLDIAALGNHEFDIREDEFYARLEESRFRYVGSNTFRPDGSPFPKVEEYAIVPIIEANDTVRIGFVGTTIPSNPKPYVMYTAPVESIGATALKIKDSVDVLVALTHLNLEDDIRLAEEYPFIHLILGGHEHENIYLKRGAEFTPIAKADANARTAYIHTISVETKSKKQPLITSELVRITPETKEDPTVKALVDNWMQKAYSALGANGFEAERVIGEVPYLLDGSEAVIRTRSNELTDLIAKAFYETDTSAAAAFYNGGSIRIDDKIPPGDITEYDVLRLLPFGGTTVTIRITGAELGRVLDQGIANKGSGGLLHTYNLSRSNDRWLLKGKPLQPQTKYTIVTTDFLLTGLERGLDFLNPKINPAVELLKENTDVRKAVISYIGKTYKK